MRAYAVFAGGGVKGTALAGALAAAEEWGIDFCGFGGTSAGSIVALLAAVGYKGNEIGAILIEKPFTEFLDDGGDELNTFLNNARMLDASNWCNAIGSVRPGSAMYCAVRKRFGLYSGRRLVDFLWTLVRDRLKVGEADRDGFTFDFLRAQGCPALKIVASDISLRRAALFPRDCAIYGEKVLDAVRMSAGFPFAFRPVRKGQSLLIDGGVASNLPCFLFGRESEEFRFPTIAFDLVQEKTSTVANIVDFMRESFFTGLEASDVIIRDAGSSIYHIPLPIPREINTLDFHITKEQKQVLYYSAYVEADRRFGDQPNLALSRGPAQNLQKQLMARHGDPKYFAPILRALVRDIEEHSSALQVRANIMLTTDRPEATRIVVYQVGMDRDRDKDIEMRETAGCSGQAWSRRCPVIANLEDARAAPEEYEMDHDLHSLVPADRMSMMSVPIPSKNGSLGTPGDPFTAPVGTLSVDSSTPLDDTLWKTGDMISPDVAAFMTSWANVVSRVLR